MAFLIYIIAFLEGFTTLSIEIIAIRNFTPIIGTNAISTSIILGVILLALSYGYYIGGKKSQRKDILTKKIVINLSTASIYYLCFSFLFGKYILIYLLGMTNSYFFSILISAFLLFFIPIFLASQTIPLLSEILKGDNTGEKIGKLLFFSTIGSFLGSLMTASLFFPTIGVYKTTILNSIILSALALLIIIISYKKKQHIHKFIIIFSLIAFILASLSIFSPQKQETLFSTANSYHNIDIYDWKDSKRVFSLNSGYSSGIDTHTKKSFFNYIREVYIRLKETLPEKILIIGAAGFTLPYEVSLEDFSKEIDVIDVDPSLQHISEKYFLQETLNKKIHFKAQPSRYFLYTNTKNYDAIIVDVYIGKSLAPQTLTYEFFTALKNSGDTIYLNIITDKDLSSDFSKTLFHTIHEAWGGIYYKIVTENIESEKNILVNIIVSNSKFDGYSRYIPNTKEIYTDDKNSIENDLFTRESTLLQIKK